MWPQKGMKTDHCPCCKACKSCSGFQKLLDAREAGFVLYRHTTLVKDIDHKKGGIQVVTDSIDDVFILENRQGIALETVDFTPELDQNKISCPRCINIIKHAQSLLQNEKLGGRNLIGVCEHCRQKSLSETTCLKCDEILEKFNFSKRKQKRVQRIKTWLAKIQRLIKQSVVETKKENLDSRISRRYSELEINRLLKKTSKTDHEPEIRDLFLQDLHDSSSYLKGPQSERSYYPALKKEVTFQETEYQYEDSQTNYENEMILQSNTTLTEKEIEMEFLRRYGKSYKYQRENIRVESNTPTSLGLTKVRNYDTDLPDAKLFENEQQQGLITADKALHASLFMSQKASQHDKAKHSRNVFEKIDSFRDKNVTDESDKKQYESERKRSYIAELDHDERRKEYITKADKHFKAGENENFIPKPDLDPEERSRKDYAPTVAKHYKSGEKESFIAETDSGHDDRRRELVPVAGKHYEYDKNKSSLTESDITQDNRRKELVPAAGKLNEHDKNKSTLTESDVTQDNRRRELVHAAGKHYKYDKKKGSLVESDLIDDERKFHKSAVTTVSQIPTAKNLHENERNKVLETGNDSGYSKREHTALNDSQEYESNKNKYSMKADTVSGQAKDIPTIDKYSENDRKKNLLATLPSHRSGKEYISSVSDHESKKNKDLMDIDGGQSGRGRRDNIPAASKHYEDEKGIDILPTTDAFHKYDKKKDFMAKAGLRYEEDKKESHSILGPHIDGAKNKEPTNEIYDVDERKKRIMTAIKRDKGERDQDFILSLGKNVEEQVTNDQEKRMDFMPAHHKFQKYDYITNDLNKPQETEMDYDLLSRYFNPLAVSRYKQEVSGMINPIVNIHGKEGKQAHVRQYHSQESLLGKVKGEAGLGFYYYFPKELSDARKKRRRAISEVSSTELIKETIDRLKLQAEEEKKKREEAAKHKEELRKQLEQERKEKVLAEQIAKDLDKKMKDEEKEKELAFKRDAAYYQKLQKDVGKSTEMVVTKVEDIDKTKLTKSSQVLKQIDIIKEEGDKSKEVKHKDLNANTKRKEEKTKDTSGKDEKAKDIKDTDTKGKGIKVIETKGRQEMDKDVKPADVKKREDKGKDVKLADVKVNEIVSSDTKGKEKKSKEVKHADSSSKEQKNVKPADYTEKKGKEKNLVVVKVSDIKGISVKDASILKAKKSKSESPKEADDAKKIVKENKIGKDKHEPDITDGNKDIQIKTKEAAIEKEGRQRESGKSEQERKKPREVREEDKRNKLAEEEKPKDVKKKGEKKTETSNKLKEPVSDQKETRSEKNEDENKTKLKKTEISPRIKNEKGLKNKMKWPSIYDLVIPKDRPKERANVKEYIPNISKHKRPVRIHDFDRRNSSDIEIDRQNILRQKQEDLNMKRKVKEVVINQTIHKFITHNLRACETKSREEKIEEHRPMMFEKHYEQNFEILSQVEPKTAQVLTSKGKNDVVNEDTYKPKEIPPEKKDKESKPEKSGNAPANNTKQLPNKKIDIKNIIFKRPSIYDLVIPKDRPKERANIKDFVISDIMKYERPVKEHNFDERNSSDLEIDRQSLLRQKEKPGMKSKTMEAVVNDDIRKLITSGSHGDEARSKENSIREHQPIIYEKTFKPETVSKVKPEAEILAEPRVTNVAKGIYDPEICKGVVRYTLSDRSFIEKGWTMLPTEKVVRKINVYRMRPAHPEFDWFERNKNKAILEYDTGERLAEFDENGRGCLYYKNGNLALDYYNAEEVNAQQRFVIYSSGEADQRGRTQPRTVLATFDYLGNGIVFDHAGKIRLKYNQTEGVVLDRSLGPVSHWKWHTLNDPPVLQQVMIDTQMAHKDPTILKLGGPADSKPRPDDEEMLAIEFDNFIKEKSAKLTQTFKPFQIKMKALKINEYFSLRVLDQATVYLIYRDGSKVIKFNIGMILDHKEIVDTDTAEVGEVSNNVERLPARTDSLAELQRNIANAQKLDRYRTDRERRIRRPGPSASVDRLTAAAARALKPPLRTLDSTSTVAPHRLYCKCRKPSKCNVYYDTSLL